MEWPTASGKRGLFPVEDATGQIVPLKGAAKQVFPLSVLVQLPLRIDAHHILHKVQVAEGHAGLQGVDGDTAVGPEHIVHVQLPDTFDRFPLELRRRRGKVGVFIAEQLVADLTGQQDPNIRLLVVALQTKYIPMLARMVVMS